MNATEIVTTLKKNGKPNTAKIYRRHGAGENVYGTPFAVLNKLSAKIKTDHALARELWKTGNIEARCLAAMIADPAKMTSAEADAWVREANFKMVGGYVAGVVAKTPFGLEKMRRWMKAKDEKTLIAGYGVLACALRYEREIPDEELATIVGTIEKTIHAAPNYARHEMVLALCAIGIYCPKYEKRVFDAARRIGTVEVDHGETNCETPDVIAYVKRARARNG